MAGKNTAVLGIYLNTDALPDGLAGLKEKNFRNTDISVLYPENIGSKDLAHEKTPKLLKALRQAPVRERQSGASSVG